jgi:hypothetical protein
MSNKIVNVICGLVALSIAFLSGILAEIFKDERH